MDFGRSREIKVDRLSKDIHQSEDGDDNVVVVVEAVGVSYEAVALLADELHTA